MLTRKRSLIYGLLGKNILERRMLKNACKKMDKHLFYKIKENERIHNIHKGKRCFILGNGPSLKAVDLGLLEDEFVFSVNNFAMVNDYKKAKTNFHIWADLSFFELRDDQKYNHNELMNNYYQIAEENPVCFVPCIAEKFIMKNKLDKVLNFNYFEVYSNIDITERKDYDLTKPICGYTTVVQYAIIIAMYMGFDEIYLLGCDTTNIISMINSALDIYSMDTHAYDNDDVNERYKELLKHWNMTDVFYDQYVLFNGYKLLAEECKKRKIKLINCSEKTLINEIERMPLMEVLKNENSCCSTDEVE